MKIKETKMKEDCQGNWKEQEQFNNITVRILHSDKISNEYKQILKDRSKDKEIKLTKKL